MNSPDTSCILCNVRNQPEWFLIKTPLFTVLCDPHPVTEGHLLIVPLEHTESMAAYSPEQQAEFERLRAYVSDFLRQTYGPVAMFEHGKFGQTIFHSHIHLLPYAGGPETIVPEGMNHCERLQSLGDLPHEGYLLFSIGGTMWTVDTTLAEPRFFRDRFAAALGNPERGDWRALQDTPILQTMKQENDSTLTLWEQYVQRVGEFRP